MCGKNYEELVDAIVEGSMLKVCLNCSRHGSVITINQAIVDQQIERKKEMESESFIDVISDRYASIIKKAREKKGLTQDDLAKAIGEKGSVVHQLEVSNLKPSLKLAKKLGVFLNMNLIETVKQERDKEKSVDFRDKTLTIGDLVKKR